MQGRPCLLRYSGKVSQIAIAGARLSPASYTISKAKGRGNDWQVARRMATVRNRRRLSALFLPRLTVGNSACKLKSFRLSTRPSLSPIIKRPNRRAHRWRSIGTEFPILLFARSPPLPTLCPSPTREMNDKRFNPSRKIMVHRHLRRGKREKRACWLVNGSEKAVNDADNLRVVLTNYGPNYGLDAVLPDRSRGTNVAGPRCQVRRPML